MLSIKTSEKTLKFDNIRVSKKEFHTSKQPIDLDSVNVDQIVISDKFKDSDGSFKYFIDYKEGKIVKPLHFILPQMSGYIKYYENGGKNMSFVTKNDDALVAKTCLSQPKMMMCWINTMKFGTRLKIH